MKHNVEIALIFFTGYLCYTVACFLIPDKKPKKQFQSYQEYLLSPEWTRKKRIVKKMFRYRCAHCKKPMSDGGVFDVHHKTYKRVYNERLGFVFLKFFVVLGDLVLLCRKCHSRIDHSKIK